MARLTWQVCVAMVPRHSTLTGRAEGWVGLSRALLRGPHSQAFLVRPQDIRVVKGDRFPQRASMCAGVCVQGCVCRGRVSKCRLALTHGLGLYWTWAPALSFLRSL